VVAERVAQRGVDAVEVLDRLVREGWVYSVMWVGGGASGAPSRPDNWP
jgi:hypothetical protein